MSDESVIAQLYLILEAIVRQVVVEPQPSLLLVQHHLEGGFVAEGVYLADDHRAAALAHVEHLEVLQKVNNQLKVNTQL